MDEPGPAHFCPKRPIFTNTWPKNSKIDYGWPRRLGLGSKSLSWKVKIEMQQFQKCQVYGLARFGPKWSVSPNALLKNPKIGCDWPTRLGLGLKSLS
jgi:hypothetical protein